MLGMYQSATASPRGPARRILRGDRPFPFTTGCCPKITRADSRTAARLAESLAGDADELSARRRSVRPLRQRMMMPMGRVGEGVVRCGWNRPLLKFDRRSSMYFELSPWCAHFPSLSQWQWPSMVCVPCLVVPVLLLLLDILKRAWKRLFGEVEGGKGAEGAAKPGEAARQGKQLKTEQRAAAPPPQSSGAAKKAC